MLASVNTGSGDVSYEDFVKFVFQQEKVVPRRKMQLAFKVFELGFGIPETAWAP